MKIYGLTSTEVLLFISINDMIIIPFAFSKLEVLCKHGGPVLNACFRLRPVKLVGE